MQRRAAAIYVALFLVIGAGAYAYTGVAEKPHVELDAPTYESGDELTVDGRTYTVNAIAETGGGGGGGHGGGGGGSIVGNLTWTDPDATYTAEIANNTTVSSQAVSWDGQDIRETVLESGATVQYNGSAHTVSVNASASPATMTLSRVTNASIADTVELGGTVTLFVDGDYLPSMTVVDISDDAATLSPGAQYHVQVPNETDPTSVSMVQQLNVTRFLVTDPSVYNQTTTIEGVEYVTYKSNDTNRRLDTYLPEPTVTSFNEGDSLTFEGTETTIGNITQTTVPLSWTDTRENEIDLSEGASLTLNEQPYFVHFPDASSVQIVDNSTNATWDAYQSDLHTIDNYNERMAGLWGVAILAFLAAFIMVLGAYIPVKD